MDNVKKLRSIRFDYKQEFHKKNMPAAYSSEMDMLRKNKIGFAAQDVQKIFPELVGYNKQKEVYGINYIGFIPILTKALQEQQDEIEAITDHKMKCEKEIEQLKAMVEDLMANCCEKSMQKSDMNNKFKSNEIKSEATLMQNHPNPFTDVTEISFMLPESINTAQLYIYNMNGTQLKSIVLHQRGNGSITISGGEFEAGMYMYTLITDGQVVDTKTMVLTD